MNLITEAYLTQLTRWPHVGQQILAQYDDSSVVVYQAYRPSIGHFAARNGYFGGEFSLTRMSWVKPGFLWMMYHSGWARKEGQEVALAVRIKREGFDLLLAQAVHSTYTVDIYGDETHWKAEVERSEVRVQWDPDHDRRGRRWSDGPYSWVCAAQFLHAMPANGSSRSRISPNLCVSSTSTCERVITAS